MRFLTTRRIIASLALAVLVLVLVAGCSGSSSGTSGSTGTGSSTTPATTGGSSATSLTIVESNFAFDPASLTVKVGDTVTFDNQDSTTHRVVVGDSDLGDQAPGQKVTWTASATGTFPVKCTIHPSMTGEIVVEAAK